MKTVLFSSLLHLSTLLLAFAQIKSEGENSLSTIKVVSGVNKVPIECVVWWCRPDGTLALIRQVEGKAGEFYPPKESTNGLEFVIIPEKRYAYYTAHVKCRDALAAAVVLAPIERPKVAKLFEQVDLKTQSPILNALKFEEMRMELAKDGGNKNHQKSFSVCVAVLLSPLIGVDRPFRFDPEVNGLALSKDFKQKLMQLQKGLDVEASGELNIRTLSRTKDVLDEHKDPEHLKNVVIPTGAKRK